MTAYNTTKVIKIKHFWLYVIAIIASLGGMLAGFDMGVISSALLFIKETWEMTPLTQGWVVSAAIVGSVIGAAANGVLADLFGRRKIIIATAIVFCLGSVLSAMAPSVIWLILGRMVIGIAVGMVTFVVPMYLSEISPQKIRGMLVAMFQLSLTAGILLSYLIGAVFADAVYNWRWMFFSGIVPSLVLFVGILFLNDTPRWLLTQKREKEALKVFEMIEPDSDAAARVSEIKQTLRQENVPGQKFKFQRWMLMPVFVGIGVMFMQIGTGINTIIYYTTTIFQMAGFDSAIGAIYATIGIGAVNFLMTLVAIMFTDKIGRKPLLYIGLTGMALSLLALGAVFEFAPLLGGSLKWVAISSIIVYVASFACSLGPVGWILVSEILPLKIRGFAMSACTVANFVINFMVVLSFLPLVQTIGEAYTFWMYSGIAVACLFFTYYMIPETKGASLEKIEQNWQKGISPRNF